MRDFSYSDIQNVVLNHYGSGSAAEVHGLLSGMLCMDRGIDRNEWLDNIFGRNQEDLDEDERLLIGQVFESTRQELDDFDFSFEPLLPEDDEFPLTERAEALSEWCQGFLAGLGFRAKETGAAWPGGCAEILRDFMAIARLDTEASDESDEVAYAELTEYVRVGAQLIRTEMLTHSPHKLH
jgi:yecA family protein